LAKQARGHGLVDDENLGGRRGVALRENAPGEHAGADGFKVTRTDAVDDRDGLVPALGAVAALDEIPADVGQLTNGMNEETLTEATPGRAARRSMASRWNAVIRSASG